MCRNARAARGHSGRPDAGRSRGGARFSARCRGPGSLRHRNSDKKSGCPGENRSRYRGDVRQGQSRCGSRSMAGSEPTPVAAELCHAWLILRTRPVLLEPGAVLAAVKDAARRTSERWPAAILDCCCARPPAGRQAGTKKRPPVSRTKKHDEVGNTGLPSKGVSLLPMINSEEAQFISRCPPATHIILPHPAAYCYLPQYVSAAAHRLHTVTRRGVHERFAGGILPAQIATPARGHPARTGRYAACQYG